MAGWREEYKGERDVFTLFKGKFPFPSTFTWRSNNII